MPSQSIARRVALVAVMGALANVLALLSVPIPLSPFVTRLHLIQVPIMLAGVIGGPAAGLFAGGIGGLLTAYQVGIPFVVGGNAILGGLSGLFARRFRLRPALAGVFAFLIQLPYVAITDLLYLPVSIVVAILIKLTAEGLVSSGLVELIVKRTPLLRVAGAESSRGSAGG